MLKAAVNSQEQVKYYMHNSAKTIASLSLNKTQGFIKIIDASGVQVLSLSRKV